MTASDAAAPVQAWLSTLDEDDLRDLLDDAMARVPGLAEWLDSRRVTDSNDPADLHALVNRDLAPHRRFYDYHAANQYANEAYDTVQIVRERAEQAPPALLPVIERAITLTTRAILKSDDSSGLQGDLVRTLLEAHAVAVATA